MKNEILEYWLILCFAISIANSDLSAQRFTFNPEVGIVCSQVDGDWLQGFDKRSYMLGIGSHYYINDALQIGFAAKYNRLGSETSASRQERPAGAFQFTTSFNVASIGSELIIAPKDDRFKIGAGITLNRVFDFSYRSLVQLDSLSRFQIEDEEIVTNFIGYNFSAHIRLFPNVFSKVTFSKSFSSIYDGEVEDSRFTSISTLIPYYLSYSVYYEFDVNSKRKNQRKKKKRRE